MGRRYTKRHMDKVYSHEFTARGLMLYSAYNQGTTTAAQMSISTAWGGEGGCTLSTEGTQCRCGRGAAVMFRT